LPHSQNIAWVVESAVRCAHVCPQLSSTDSLFSSGLQEGNYTNVGSTLPSWMHQNIFAQSSADGYTLFSSVDTPYRNLIYPVNGSCSIINTVNLTAINSWITNIVNNFGVCLDNASGYTVRLMLAYILLLIAPQEISLSVWRFPFPSRDFPFPQMCRQRATLMSLSTQADSGTYNVGCRE